jgi:uncharacterized protein DUF4157
MHTFQPKEKRPSQQASSSNANPSTLAHSIRQRDLQSTINGQEMPGQSQTGFEDGDTDFIGSHSRLTYNFANIPLFPPPVKGIQRKLTVNAPGDTYEQEADRVAEQVMRMADPGAAVAPAVSGGVAGVQRQCACGGICDDCNKKQDGNEHKPLQMKPAGPASMGGIEAPAIVHDVLRSSGQLLDARTRSFMEPRFGHDFSKVIVHTDAKAAESARAVQAKAYTVGSNVVFGAGQYEPRTDAGQRLMGHELAHVVQQRSSQGAAQVQRQPTNTPSGETPGQSATLPGDLVPFRQLTWNDFQGQPPTTDPDKGAAVDTRIAKPKFDPKVDAAPSKPKKACIEKVGPSKQSQQAQMYDGQAVPDPQDLNSIAAGIHQATSWARKLYKTGDGRDYCGRKQKACEDGFDRNSKGFIFNNIKIGKREDCNILVIKNCIDKEGPAERERELRHEQYHFNITNIFANKAKDDITAKANALKDKGKVQACGNDAAHEAAHTAYESAVRPTLTRALDDWRGVNTKAQDDYDSKTNHGGIGPEQLDYQKRIDQGLSSKEDQKRYALPPDAAGTPATSTPSSPQKP